MSERPPPDGDPATGAPNRTGIGGVSSGVGVPPADLEALFRAEYSGLVRALIWATGDAEVAADVVQDAFVQAGRHWRRVCRYDDPAAWVRRAAFNRAANHRRGARRLQAALPRLAGPDRAEQPEPAVDLAAAMARLAPGQRAAVALFYVLDLPVDEVAQTLGVSAGTVKSQLHDARHKLAPLLEVDDVPR